MVESAAAGVAAAVAAVGSVAAEAAVADSTAAGEVHGLQAEAPGPVVGEEESPAADFGPPRPRDLQCLPDT